VVVEVDVEVLGAGELAARERAEPAREEPVGPVDPIQIFRLVSRHAFRAVTRPESARMQRSGSTSRLR
jgi:hypothetical protein